MTEAELDTTIQQNRLELFAIYKKYDDDWNERVRLFREENGPEPTLADRYRLMLGQCDELIEQIKQHQRLLRFRNGEKIEPQAHEANVVIRGLGQGAL